MLLDANRNPIAARDTLERVIPPPRPEFGPLTENESHAEVAARVGDRFDVALPAASPDATLTAWTMITPTPNSSIALETTFGSGIGLKGVFTIFVLKAVAPGSARIEFRSTKSQKQIVTFSFRVAP
jgi:hypothetical protein